MSAAAEDLIQKAIAAAKGNDRPAARKLLAQALRQAPNDARAWYLLSQVAESREQAIFCLSQVLRIEPDNPQAAARLERFRSEAGGAEPAAGADIAGIPTGEASFTDTGFPLPPASRSGGQPAPAGRRSGGRLALLLILALCLAAALAGGYAYRQGWLGAFLPPAATQPTVPAATALAQGTPPGTAPAASPAAASQPAGQPGATVSGSPTPAAPLFGGQSDCLPTRPITYTGMVTRIIDGDTIEISLAGRTSRLRYLGVDAPSLDDLTQPAYQAAVDAASRNRELVLGKSVTIIFATPPAPGQADIGDPRRGLVFVPDLSGTLVNQALLEAGLARLDPGLLGPGCRAQFQQAEEAARQADIGVWQPTLYPSATPENIGLYSPGGCGCTGPDLGCENFATRFAAQSCYNMCQAQGLGDIFQLDEDGDGIACENLP